MEKMTRKNIFLLVLTIFGLLLTIELCYVYINANFLPYGLSSFCSVNSTIDCDGVAKTTFSQFLGVPLAFWGVFFYFIMLFLLGLDYIKKLSPKVSEFLDVFKNPYAYMATLGVVSFIISILLASISIFAIHKICVLCFATYFINLAIAFNAKSEGSLFIKDIETTIKDFIDGVKKYPIPTIVAIILAVSILTYTSISHVLAPQLKNKNEFSEFSDLKKNKWPTQGNVLGNKDAKYVVYEYTDFECPFCRVANYMFHKLASENKDVRVEHYNFPLDTTCNPYIPQTMHKGACMLAQYALAASMQDKYWQLSDQIFDKQIRTEEEVLRAASELGLDTAKLSDDAYSLTVQNKLKFQILQAHEQGVVGTPSFALKGVRHEGLVPYNELVKMVKGQIPLNSDERL